MLEPDYPDVCVVSTKSTCAFAGHFDEETWLHTIDLRLILSFGQHTNIEIGQMLAYRSDFNAVTKSGHNLFDAFDQHSSDVRFAASSVIDEEGEWLSELNGELFGCDILYIDRLHISPLLRGHRLGLAFVDRCIALEGQDCGVIILDSYPEQYYAERYSGSETDDCVIAVQSRIAAYFEQLGFRKLANSRYLGYFPAETSSNADQLGLTFSYFDSRWDSRIIDALLAESPPREYALRPKTRRIRDDINSEHQVDRLIALIKKGEGQNIEFKSSIVWNIRANKHDLTMRDEVLKEICAFLNADGGTIVCGVADNGTILGLERDIKHCGNLDRLLLQLANAFGDLIRPNPVELVRFTPHSISGTFVISIDVKADATQRYESVSTKPEDAGRRVMRTYVRINSMALGLDTGTTISWWQRRQEGSKRKKSRKHG